MGVGGTLLACSMSERKGVGVDISEKYIDIYKQANKTFMNSSFDFGMSRLEHLDVLQTCGIHKS